MGFLGVFYGGLIPSAATTTMTIQTKQLTHTFVKDLKRYLAENEFNFIYLHSAMLHRLPGCVYEYTPTNSQKYSYPYWINFPKWLAQNDCKESLYFFLDHYCDFEISFDEYMDLEQPD